MKRLLCVALLPSLLGGCIIHREITSMLSHPTANNFKVQTLTTRYAVFAAWVEFDVWTCQREEGDKVTCRRPRLP
jgi:hypothetical protein